MGFVIGLLAAILFLDCLLLTLLILIQLPKKEAGIGTAFGGAATDALFGAGKGNALTQMTKYAAALFFILSFGLAIIGSHRAHVGDRTFKAALQAEAASSVAPQPAPASGSSNLLQISSTASNLMASKATNAIESIKTSTNSPGTPPK